MSQALLIALRTRLATSTGTGGFFNLLNSRVYLDAAPGDTELPLCVYSATNTRYERAFSGSKQETLSVVFTLYASQSTPGTIQTAADALRTLIDGYDLAPSGYDRARCILRVRGEPAFEDEIWSISETYEITGLAK